MAYKNAILVISILLSVNAKFICAGTINRTTIGSCGLTGVDSETSPTNPLTLPPIPDNIQNNIRAWENPTFGSLSHVTVDPSPHSAYLTSVILTLPTPVFWLNGNARTKDFVREQETREMLRNVTIHCTDGSTSKYYLAIPVNDILPPVFEEPEYTLNITSNWQLDRPITEGVFIDVCDNAVELESGESLKFEGLENMVRAVAYSLWTSPAPSQYCFRVYLFLRGSGMLVPGESLAIELVAKDGFSNAGKTTVNINVMPD